MRLRETPETTRVIQGLDWTPGALIAFATGAVYLALLPPLYDFDGYMYRFYALLPNRMWNSNPHHLLWNSVQILLVMIAKELGHPTTMPFQIFGILISCATLLLFYRLLLKAGGSLSTAAFGTILIALSPPFWYLGLQNHPYPLTFLAIVSFLSIWRPQPERPQAMELAAAGMLLLLAATFHQAVILLLPGAMMALFLFGQGPIWRRLSVSLLWAAGVIIPLTALYVGFWLLGGRTAGTPLFSWATDYVNDVHPVQLFELGIWKTTARSLMGFSGSIVQDYRLKWLLQQCLGPATVCALYALSAIIAIFVLTALMLRFHRRKALFQLMRNNGLFTVSLFSVISWWLFSFAWEPATAHYWVLSLFPGLVCVVSVLPRLGNYRWIAASVVLLSFWNGYFNHAYDQFNGRYFSEAMLEKVERHVGTRDVLIVLSDDQWHAQVNYILVFRVLHYLAPGRGIAIINDLVLPSGAQSWRQRLADKIDSVIDSGGRAYIAAHVLDPRSYRDPSQARNPFNEETNKSYLTLDIDALHRGIVDLFSRYELRKCEFTIGADDYLSVQRRQ